MSRIVLSADVSATADTLLLSPPSASERGLFLAKIPLISIGCGIRSPSPADTLRCPYPPLRWGIFFRSLSAQTPHQEHQGRSPNEDAE